VIHTPPSFPIPRRYARNRKPLIVSGIIQCSVPIAPFEDDLDYSDEIRLILRPTQRQPGTIALIVRGHSLDDGTPRAIRHNDIVLVNTNDPFAWGNRPCAFATPNGVIGKIRAIANGRYALTSLNPTVPPIYDLHDVRPLGRIVGIYRGPYQVDPV